MDPNIILLAGPNGAGKSTAAPDLLHDALHVDEFVNADVIARGLSAFNPEGAALDAGRVMLSRLRELAAQRKNIAFESTLASRTFAPWIRELKKTGYRFHLFYFWLPSPELCVNRVRERKSLGGHTVPEETIHRRYHAGIRNFFELYAPIAYRWKFFDNTKKPRVLISAGGESMEEETFNTELWAKLKKEYQHV
ncbi:MAG: zeta toxin family protein [Bryobacteraceae bacterium]